MENTERKKVVDILMKREVAMRLEYEKHFLTHGTFWVAELLS